MSEVLMQLVLENDRISVHASVFDGVLVTKTFEGDGCYRQLLDFIRGQFGVDPINASIIIR